MSLEIPDERAGAPEPRERGVLEPGPPSPPAEWWLDRGLAEQLYALVERHDLSSPMAEDVIAGLARDHGDLVYAELIFLLTRLRLDPAAARRHWPGVLARQTEVGRRTQDPREIRAPLLSDFPDAAGETLPADAPRQPASHRRPTRAVGERVLRW